MFTEDSLKKELKEAVPHLLELSPPIKVVSTDTSFFMAIFTKKGLIGQV